MALSAPRTISILSTLSSVKLEKSTAPPGGLMVAPSTRTLVKLELPPFKKSEAVPPSAPVLAMAMPVEYCRMSGSVTAWRASISSRVMVETGAEVCCSGRGSAWAVTTTWEESGFNCRWMSTVRVSLGRNSSSCEIVPKPGRTNRTRCRPPTTANEKLPSSCEIADAMECESARVSNGKTSTVASATPAPLLSRIVPDSVAVTDWFCANDKEGMANRTRQNREKCRKELDNLDSKAEKRDASAEVMWASAPSRAGALKVVLRLVTNAGCGFRRSPGLAALLLRTFPQRRPGSSKMR